MSDTKPVAEVLEDDDTAIEARAKTQGWRPQSEYRGPPERWRDARTFLSKGEEEMPLIRERNRQLEHRLTKVTTELTEATVVMNDLAERTRKAEQRGYEKAKRELEAKRREAVTSGDVEGYDAVERDLKELEAPAPKPVVPVVQPPQDLPPPEVVDWGNRNPWFLRDPELKQFATDIHITLMRTAPHLSLSQNLEEVSGQMRRLYPARVGNVVAAGDDGRGAAEGTGRGAREPEEEESRGRGRASPVSGSREVSGRRGGPRSFDAMPTDTKDAFERMQRSIAGKGKPLTKEEWAADYWAQFD